MMQAAVFQAKLYPTVQKSKKYNLIIYSKMSRVLNIIEAFQDKNSLSLENTLQDHNKIQRPSIKSVASVDEDPNSFTIL